MKIRYFLLVMIIMINIMAYTRVIGSAEQSVTGPLTAINDESRAVQIGDTWYYLEDDTVIIRNGIESSLESCRPLGTGFYQWAWIILSPRGKVEQIEVDYSVLEGIILAFKPDSLELKVYRNHSEEPSTIVLGFTPEVGRKLNGLKEGEHLILLVAGNKAYKLVN